MRAGSALFSLKLLQTAMQVVVSRGTWWVAVRPQLPHFVRVGDSFEARAVVALEFSCEVWVAPFQVRAARIAVPGNG